MDAPLTKEADRLLVLMYKHYLEKRKSGVSRSNAKSLGGSEEFQPILAPDMPLDDVDDLCREMDRAGFLDVMYADDTIWIAQLTDAAISNLENRFKKGLLSVVEFISKFVP